MKRALLLVCLCGPAAAQDRPELVIPDELLSIPHILKTPIVSDFAVAPDGGTVALSLSALGKQTIWMMPKGDMAGAPIATSRGMGERDVDWSPDGERIAFVGSRADLWHVFVSDPKGERARQVTRHRGQDRWPRWSPDGTRLAYLSQRVATETGWDLWVTSLSEGKPRQLTEHPFDEADHRWSPDGKRIALTFRAGRHVNRSVGVVDVESGELINLLPTDWTGDSFGPRWSPDGKQISFVSDEQGMKNIYVVTFLDGERGKPARLLESDYELTEPAWSPDGKYLAYVENREGNLRLKLHDFAEESDRMLTLRAGVHSQPVWSPDGKAVLSLFEAYNYPRDVWAYPVEGGRERVSDTLPQDLDVRKMSRPELIRYESFDEKQITGYLYVPEEASAENAVPLLVRPHGGPTSQWKNGWHPFAQLLTQQGYAVFAPNVRGSTGFGLEFENANDRAWGHGDLEDLMYGARVVASRPEIRDDRVGIWGVSYGGFLTLAAITRYPDYFTCAVEAVGMPDLEALYRETNMEGRTYLDRELGPLAGNLELYRQLSPLASVASTKTPLLSFHGQIYPSCLTKRNAPSSTRSASGPTILFSSSSSRTKRCEPPTGTTFIHPRPGPTSKRFWSSWKSICDDRPAVLHFRFRQYARLGGVTSRARPRLPETPPGARRETP